MFQRLRLLPSVLLCFGFHQAEKPWILQEVDRGITVQTPVPLKPFKAASDPRVPMKVWNGVGAETVYVVTVGQLPNGKIVRTDTWIAGSIAGFAQKDYNRVVAQKDILVNGWPGFEAIVDQPDGTRMLGRGIRIAPKIYSLIATIDNQSEGRKNAQRFFDSFSIPSAIGKGPFTRVGPTFETYPLVHQLTATFPEKPELAEIPGTFDGQSMKIHRYDALYANRTFVVTTALVPLPSDYVAAKRSEILKFMSDRYAVSFGSIVAQRNEPLGDDPAIWYDLKLERGLAGEMVAVLRGNLWFVATETYPKCFAKSQEVQDFLKSVKAEK